MKKQTMITAGIDQRTLDFAWTVNYETIILAAFSDYRQQENKSGYIPHWLAQLLRNQ